MRDEGTEDIDFNTEFLQVLVQSYGFVEVLLFVVSKPPMLETYN